MKITEGLIHEFGRLTGACTDGCWNWLRERSLGQGDEIPSSLWEEIPGKYRHGIESLPALLKRRRERERQRERLARKGQMWQTSWVSRTGLTTREEGISSLMGGRIVVEWTRGERDLRPVRQSNLIGAEISARTWQFSARPGHVCDEADLARLIGLAVRMGARRVSGRLYGTGDPVEVMAEVTPPPPIEKDWEGWWGEVSSPQEWEELDDYDGQTRERGRRAA